ncbi:hypothetical protein HPP92_021358 [Vanilla planifolia]|uniref:Uncharacterized protein n=1 Tax=Vanilla planifolia TaxID=51239 RepID=A0A835PV94_VANPL|nr:hypothetical protein HPP92_021358 [Vanilla planifolia]
MVHHGNGNHSNFNHISGSVLGEASIGVVVRAEVDRKDHKSRDREQMGGGMGAEKNKFIEEVGSRGENLEYNFRWTRRNLAIVGLFGVAVPILIYKGIVNEFHMQDEDWGRPPRKFI